MNCYHHIDAPSVGICKHCYKGICPDCANDTGSGLACTGTCAADVEAVSRLIATNRRIYAEQKRNVFLLPAFFLALGLFFLFYGYLRSGLSGFVAITGLGFTIFGLVYGYVGLRWRSKIDTDA